jgi:hypothetical protein
MDFDTWLVSYISDDQPFEYFLYKRSKKRADYLFTTRPGRKTWECADWKEIK